jgi:hypothetical protein
MAHCLHTLRTVLVAALLLGKSELWSQKTLQGKITGEKGEALPYTAVLVKNSGKGYLSNEEGLFIVNAGPLDTLLIRHIGYKPIIMAASALEVSGTVRMQTDVRQIGEVTVHPGDDYLYREVLLCREALASQPSFRSKAYYLLEGEANGKPTELMECYYNSVYSARKVEQLVFKNGRVALAPADHTYFISTDFSKAFAMNDVTLPHPRLPLSPLHLGGKHLRKQYELSLGGYSGPNGEVMRIICTPRRDAEKYYTGELWINTSTHLPLKIVLDIPHTRRHPLLSLHQNRGEISNAGIHFEKVFVSHQGKHLVKNTLLRYNYTFTPLRRQHGDGRIPLHATSKALIHFYDHDELFIPPYFSYDPRHDDYKNIAGMSYNESFWNYNNSFFQSRSMQEKIKHFRQHGFLLNYRSGVLLEDGSWGGAMYEANYLPWKDKRRLFIRKGHVTSDTLKPVEFHAREGRALFELRRSFTWT